MRAGPGELPRPHDHTHRFVGMLTIVPSSIVVVIVVVVAASPIAGAAAARATVARACKAKKHTRGAHVNTYPSA